MLSFESLSRDHLRTASTPFWDRFSAGAVRSAYHAASSPTTNTAHAAWYAGDYRGESFGHLQALRAAGYRTLYMSAAETEHYGLEAMLKRAGFEQVIDGRRFRPEPGDEGRPSDWVLPAQVPAMLETFLDGEEPFYLHVHAANAHMPYRVVDRARFSRHVYGDDLGRFLNSIEETDAVFQKLFYALSEGTGALTIVTSDHGQSFGGFGYFGHGSSVVNDQIAVPFALRHAALAPEAIAFSSHLDVLPTILDLAGVRSDHPTFGDSIFHADRTPELVVWDGNPSRHATSNYGAIFGDKKIIVDLVRDTVLESDLDDRHSSSMSAGDRAYTLALLAELKHKRGIE